MSESRKRCPKGEHYNKETNRCEPKVASESVVSSLKVSRRVKPKTPSPPKEESKATSRRAKPKTPSPPKAESKATSQRAKPNAEPKDSNYTVDSFISRGNSDTYRLLVSVPVNNSRLWPNNNICFFRSTGTSNAGFEIFKGSWFPIVGIKDNSTMQGFLPEQPDGFFIKMAFIMNKNNDYSNTHKQPKWIINLVGDYPIPLDETERSLFNNKSIITIDEFVNKNKYIEKKKTRIIDTQYHRIALCIKLIIKNEFEGFLNYFLYEWQAMLSLRIGGGYWDSKPEFKEYISSKLAAYDLVPVAHIDETLKTASETELREIYESNPDNNKVINRVKPTIDFSKRVGTQLSMEQINAIKTTEEKKIKEQENHQVSSLPFRLFTEMEERYSRKVDNYIQSAQNEITMNARLAKR